MSQLSHPPRHGHGESTSETESASTADLTELLNDAYARRILEEIHGEAKPARALVEACDASRPTVYRRLNALGDAGLVESTMQYHPDGHHREVFEAVVDEVTISLDPSGFSSEVRTGDPTPTAGSGVAD